MQRSPKLRFTVRTVFLAATGAGLYFAGMRAGIVSERERIEIEARKITELYDARFADSNDTEAANESTLGKAVHRGMLRDRRIKKLHRDFLSVSASPASLDVGDHHSRVKVEN